MKLPLSCCSFAFLFLLSSLAVAKDAVSVLLDGYVSIYLYKVERTGSRHANVKAELTIPGKYFENLDYKIRYSEENEIKGSNEDQVVEYDFDSELRVSSDDVKSLLNRLIDQGVFEATDEESAGGLVSGQWVGSIDFHKSEESFPYHLSAEMLETVLSFISSSRLNVPKEPREVSLCIGVTDVIDLKTDSPVWSPGHYNQKTIESIERLGAESGDFEKVKIEFSGDEGEGVSPIIGKLKFPGLDLERFIGKEIWWVSTNNERHVSEGDHRAPIEATVAEVLGRPKFYDGKRVRMKGFSYDQFENQTFYDDSSKKSLWMGEVSNFAIQGTRNRTGYTTVEGVFFKGASGHFGLLSGEIRRITRMRTIPMSLGYIVIYFILVVGTIGGVGYRVYRSRRRLRI